MATTAYGVNHPLAVKAWAKSLYAEAINQVSFSPLMGADTNSIICVKNELKKGRGDRIRQGLRMQLSGSGVQGDDTLQGNEEALVTYTDDLLINQLRHAVRSAGRMTQQRVTFEIREEARQGLTDWWTTRLETWFANQLCGASLVTDTRFTGNNATLAPSSNNFIVANGEATEASLSTSTVHQFSLTLIDRCVAKAKTLSPLIRPTVVDGAKRYAMFLHQNQVYQLRTNTSTGQWLDITKAAMAGQDSGKSNIYTGALGVYNGVVLYENPYLPAFTLGGSGTGNARRAVFCGAQAALFGTGNDGMETRMSWDEEAFDYGNQLGVSSGMIAGCKKTQFNSQDFGTITVATYSPAP